MTSEVLSDITLTAFRGLERDEVETLCRFANNRSLPQGKVIFTQNTAAEHFYLIRSGRVSVEVPALYGEPLRVQTVNPGEILGWSWLIPPYRWHFNAEALEDTELTEFDGKAILDLCEKNKEFGYSVFKFFSALMSERLQAARASMMDEWGQGGGI